MAWYRNFYECDCGASWEDEWSCCCDDECPHCGADISPEGSIDISEQVGATAPAGEAEPELEGRL